RRSRRAAEGRADGAQSRSILREMHGPRAARSIAAQVLGWILVVAGVAALVLPGPGLLALFAGMALLATQYSWAERRLAPVRRAAHESARHSVETPPRTPPSVCTALGTAGPGR